MLYHPTRTLAELYPEQLCLLQLETGNNPDALQPKNGKMWFINIMEYYSVIKTSNLKICKQMDGTRKYYEGEIKL